MSSERVSVICRFRPVLDIEEANAASKTTKVDTDSPTFPAPDTVRIGSKEFKFNRVFSPDARQDEVYEESGVSALIGGLIGGFNAAVVAYGQTGAGKTFTMQGPAFGDPRSSNSATLADLSRGIIPRAIEELLARLREPRSAVEAGSAAASELIDDDAQPPWELSGSYLEVYNEQLRDLLDPKDLDWQDRSRQGLVKATMPRRRLAQTSAGLRITNVRAERITSLGDVSDMMRRGSTQRVVAATKSNEESSRSHAVLLLTLVQRSAQLKATTTSQLYLVDLAGSEKVSKTGAEGTRLVEAKSINASLFTLGQVIWALSRHEKHIPYRNSLLTRILQNAVGGNSRTLMVVNCSPHYFNLSETISTLRFGARAQSVENEVRVNQERSAAELLYLLEAADRSIASKDQELASLRLELGRMRDFFGVADPRQFQENDAATVLDNETNFVRKVSAPLSSSSSLLLAIADGELGASTELATNCNFEASGDDGRVLATSVRQRLEARARDLRDDADSSHNLRARETRIRLPFLFSLPQITCPISGVLLDKDPVVAADGWSYDRQAFLGWISRNELARSPVTNQRLSTKTTFSNLVLKRLLAEDPAALEQAMRLATDVFGMYAPSDILFEIFRKLEARDLCVVSRVCALWWSVSREDRLWDDLCVRSRLSDRPQNVDAKSWFGQFNTTRQTRQNASNQAELVLFPAT